jgi:RHS repeat-associated protein
MGRRTAYGSIRTQTGTQPNEFTFTGEQVDTSGLQYLRARYYDGATGRFVGRDPLPLMQRYAYVGGNSVNLTDPSGLCGWTDPGDCVDQVAKRASDQLLPGSGLADTVGSRVGAVGVLGLDATNAALQTSSALFTDKLVLDGCLLGFEVGATAGPVGAVGGCILGGTGGYLLGQSNSLPSRFTGQVARFGAVRLRSTFDCDPEGTRGIPQVPPGSQVDPNISAILAWQALYQDVPSGWDTIIHGK